MLPIVRIFLYTFFGALASRGIINDGMAREFSSDPSIIEGAMQIVGVIGWFFTAGWYWVAKKLGWKT